MIKLKKQMKIMKLKLNQIYNKKRMKKKMNGMILKNLKKI